MGVRGKSPDPAEDATGGAAPNGDPNPAGRGDYDSDTGLSEWYEETEEAQGVTLTQLWAYRDLIEADLHSEYGLDVDLEEPDSSPALTGRSWRWFLVRLRGLLEVPHARIVMALTPDEPKPPTVPQPRQPDTYDTD